MERRNVIYIAILSVLVAAILVVSVLILRKRAVPGIRPSVGQEQGAVARPPGTVPIESYTPVPPWKEGDPIPEEVSNETGPLPEEITP